MTREEARLTLQENFGYLSEEHPRIIEAMKVAMNILSQPSLPPNMDEAAKEYLKQYNESEFGNGGDDWDDDILITFKAGAEWMAGQGVTVKKKIGKIDDGVNQIPTYCNGFEITELDVPFLNSKECGYGNEVIVQIRKKQ